MSEYGLHTLRGATVIDPLYAVRRAELRAAEASLTGSEFARWTHDLARDYLPAEL